MVYLKFKRSDTGEWHFVFNLKEVVNVGRTDEEKFDDYGASVLEYLNGDLGDPFVIIGTNNDGDTRAYAFWGTEAYLCDQKSGSTVEYLFNLR